MKGEVMRILCTYRDDLAGWTFAQFHYKIINELKNTLLQLFRPVIVFPIEYMP